jgi:SAM-dependent methyltransferase
MTWLHKLVVEQFVTAHIAGEGGRLSRPLPCQGAQGRCKDLRSGSHSAIERRRCLTATCRCCPSASDPSFDRALSVQVLEYVSDPAAALAELHRALRPGGRLVVWDVDWSTVSWHSADPDRMRRVLAVWDGHLADPCLPRTLAARQRSAGFGDIRADGHTFAEEAAGRWAAEQHELGEQGEFFFACIQFCFTATRSD